MTRRRALEPAVGLVAVAVVSALLVMLVAQGTWGDRGDRRPQPAQPAGLDELDAGGLPSSRPLADGLEARGTLEPRAVLFGDTTTAVIDVVVDRRRVDPESVKFTAGFVPWEVVGNPTEVRHDADETTHLRTTYTLRCLTSACAPTGQSISTKFSPAHVSYSLLGARSGRSAEVEITWPLLPVYSRSAASIAEGRGSLIPWRGDLVTQPAASYRLAPSLAAALALIGCALAALGAVILLFLAWRARMPAAVPEPEPEPEPELSPLEHALVLLEDTATTNGAADRRRALELVAEELALRDARLAETARVLAWSEGIPKTEATTDLAARVRSLIEDVVDEEMHDDAVA